MGKKGKAKGRVGPGRGRSRPYPYEFRLQLVRLYLEEHYSIAVLKEQFGVSSQAIRRWVKVYRQHGEKGLVPKLPPGPKPRISEAVKKRIVGVKESHPEYGPRRISDVLKRRV